MLAWAVTLTLCASCCAAMAETAENPVPGIGEGLDGSFSMDDVPESYLTEAEHAGRVEKIFYFTTRTCSDRVEDVKSVMVYFPAGYDDSTASYNVLYLLHGANGSTKSYLDPAKPTEFQCLLDHMIENGDMEPIIVVAATYYPPAGSAQYLPLAEQVKLVADFPRELAEEIVPAVEEQVRSYAASTSPEDIAASRDHRAIAGFSLGGVATWYVFQQQMRAFKWFLPISEASWDDGKGGTSGILDSDLSAQVLYDAVLAQGYSAEDFKLYVATGTEDTAFDITTRQMISLLGHNDLFKIGGNTNCSMMIGGTHTLSALVTYLYHLQPELFSG